MAKSKSVFVCSNCGAESPKWIGKCPSCHQWNTYVEERISSGSDSKPVFRDEKEKARPRGIQEIKSNRQERIPLYSGELNRLLGGGLVPGSLVLLGGEPGIGKSTLALQAAIRAENKVLYVSGEESEQQIKLRADRLGPQNPEVYIYTETLLEKTLDQAMALKPGLLIIDSVQTLYSRHLESSPGSVSQVRECTAMLLKYAKESNTPVLLIGHITKDGHLAGPKVLEHIVDVVLQFEGDRNYAYRILRSLKNRFGSTAELAIYEMKQKGLEEVTNPSEILLSNHADSLSGIALSAGMEGIRPLLLEIQSLVSSAVYGTPQRSTTGFDLRRLNMLLAVLEKRAGFRLGVKDVFLNITGGLKITDPANDLAVMAAVLSSNLDIPIAKGTVFSAEGGLSGEIRPVSRVEQRIKEAEKLGCETCYLSAYQKDIPKNTPMEIIRVARVEDLVKKLFA